MGLFINVSRVIQVLPLSIAMVLLELFDQGSYTAPTALVLGAVFVSFLGMPGVTVWLYRYLRKMKQNLDSLLIAYIHTLLFVLQCIFIYLTLLAL